MSGRFADLMALSASQTRQADDAAKTLREQMQAKEKARVEAEVQKSRRDQELQRATVRRVLEETRRKEEQERKAEENKRRKEEQLEKQGEQHIHKLLYGPTKTSRSNGSSGRTNGASRAAPRGKKDPQNSEDELEAGAMALTREEKRAKKLMADLNKGGSSIPSTRKSTPSSSYSKHGRVLKGGAIDATTTNLFDFTPTAATQHLSIKARIAAAPNYLQKLNTVKRDTRTIDEILRDRQKARESKVLDGDEAKDFHDWFTSKPKKDPKSAVQRLSSQQPSASPTPSRGLTPIPTSSQPKPSTTSSSSAPTTNKPAANKTARPPQRNSPRPDPPSSQPRTKITLVKPQQGSSSLMGKVAAKPSAPGTASPKPKTLAGKSSNASFSASAPKSQARPRSHSVNAKKRSLSESLDDDSEFESRSVSPPPKKRMLASPAKNDISSQIWQLFGKDRSRYMKADVYSDEEDDMEADADSLRREEMRSARLAKKEDQEAFKEEARHEEEKRRKRKEKEMRERRS